MELIDFNYIGMIGGVFEPKCVGQLYADLVYNKLQVIHHLHFIQTRMGTFCIRMWICNQSLIL